MIVRTKERLYPEITSTITLQDDDGYYYYLNIDLYNQALILTDRYGEEVDGLKDILGVCRNKEAIDYFLTSAPKPIAILGVYLTLISKEGLSKNLDELCGCLSVMSQVLNFREMIKFPAEMRNSVTFVLSIREEYKNSWERFINENRLAVSNARTSKTTKTVQEDNNDGDEEFESSYDFSGVDFNLDLSEDDTEDTPEETVTVNESRDTSGLKTMSSILGQKLKSRR